MRAYLSISLLLAVPLAAQQPRQLTAADYERAERALAPNVAPLVTGLGVRPTWLADGRFWYRTTLPNGSGFFLVDPARRSRESLFDATRLASALATATGGRVDANRLPFQAFELGKDNRSITVNVRNRRFACDLQQYSCAAADSTSGGMAAPENSSVSPDGRTAVYIKSYNLFAKDLTSGRETQLTTDGVKEYGYATDNAGWTHSDRPIVTWSPDSRQIATYQQDERGTRDMYLVRAKAGNPELEAWKYPLPGDSVIFRISRVIIKLNPGGSPSIVRFQMPPDQHRSTVSDHVACAGGICDVEWYPDGSHLAFVRQAAPRLEAHDAVVVVEENRRAARVHRVLQLVERDVVDLLERGGMGDGVSHPVHGLQLVELLTELGRGVTLLSDIALDAHIADRLTRGVVDSERGELDDQLPSVLGPALTLAARGAGRGNLLGDQRELLVTEVNRGRRVAKLVIAVAEELRMGCVLLEVGAVGIDDRDRFGGLDEDRAIEGEG